MDQVEAVRRATAAKRSSQSWIETRKESLSALVATLMWVATLIADNADAVPEEVGQVGAMLSTLCSVVVVLIARFTVPALTRGQAEQLVREAHWNERDDEIEAEAARPAALPVYTGPTTAEVVEPRDGQ